MPGEKEYQERGYACPSRRECHPFPILDIRAVERGRGGEESDPVSGVGERTC